MLKEMQINCIKFVSEMTFTTLIDRDKKKRLIAQFITLYVPML